MDPSIVAALEQAVHASPDNPHLRCHLAQVLNRAGRHAEALQHDKAGVAVVADDVALLEVAVVAGHGAGTDIEGYRRLPGGWQTSSSAAWWYLRQRPAAHVRKVIRTERRLSGTRRTRARRFLPRR